MKINSKKSFEDDKLLSIGNASEYLGVSIDTLRRWANSGKIKELRSPGNHRYFKLTDLNKLFNTKYERVTSSNILREEKEITTKVEQKTTNHILSYIPPEELPIPPEIHQTIPNSNSHKVQDHASSSTETEQNYQNQVEKPTPIKTPDTSLTAELKRYEESSLFPNETKDTHKTLKAVFSNEANKEKNPDYKKIIILAFTAFAIINALIYYFWFASRQIISPIP